MAKKAKLELVDDGTKKYLTQSEMDKFEIENLKEVIRKQELSDLEQKKQIIMLKVQYYNLQVDLCKKDIELLEKNKLEKLSVYDKERNEHKKFVKSLKEKLNITTERFGFNPDTGEIVIDD